MVQVILKMPGQPDSPLTIPPGQYQIGSSEAVPIQLPFVGVSKLHCVLQATESTLRIADLGSSNGTDQYTMAANRLIRTAALTRNLKKGQTYSVSVTARLGSGETLEVFSGSAIYS